MYNIQYYVDIEIFVVIKDYLAINDDFESSKLYNIFLE